MPESLSSSRRGDNKNNLESIEDLELFPLAPGKGYLLGICRLFHVQEPSRQLPPGRKRGIFLAVMGLDGVIHVRAPVADKEIKGLQPEPVDEEFG